MEPTVVQLLVADRQDGSDGAFFPTILRKLGDGWSPKHFHHSEKFWWPPLEPKVRLQGRNAVGQDVFAVFECHQYHHGKETAEQQRGTHFERFRLARDPLLTEGSNVDIVALSCMSVHSVLNVTDNEEVGTDVQLRVARPIPTGMSFAYY